MVGSPNSTLSSVILSGNEVHFGADGCFWLKQVMPYHPEIKELAIDNNAIGDDGLLLFIQSLSLRHDPNNVRTVYPIKLLQRLNLSNNQISDVHIGELLDNLMVYTRYLREIDL